LTSDFPPNKTVVIIWDQNGQFANELWNYMNIFAYCLEKGYQLKNYVFYKYGRFFNIPVGNPLVDWAYFKTFPVYQSLIPNRFGHYLSDRIYRYTLLNWIRKSQKPRIICAHEHVYYLPPTRKSEPILNYLEKDSCKTIYFYGWLFRNPVGLQKYRQKILNYFHFNEDTFAEVQRSMITLRSKYRHIVGIHIRQTDYRVFQHGRHYVNPQQTAIFARQYLQHFQKKKPETCFVICSDEKVDLQYFSDLKVMQNNGTLIEDFLALASTDVILGSNSTYGALASWYGNIPHIIMLKEGIDWNYYTHKNGYFENKYNTTMTF
jgi:hypothetical protein